MNDLPCVKEWNAWTPRTQKSAVIRGMLCRSWYFSNSAAGRRYAIYESLLTLVGRAKFPKTICKHHRPEMGKRLDPEGFFVSAEFEFA